MKDSGNGLKLRNGNQNVTRKGRQAREGKQRKIYDRVSEEPKRIFC